MMTRFFISLLVVAFLFGCNGELSRNGTKQVTLLKNQHLTVSAPAEINAEQLFDIEIQASHDVSILSARLIGESMDMGIVPLVFVKQSNGHSVATTLVGRCALPTMQWRMEITWQQNSQKHQSELLMDVKR